jgi:predicted DNA-binding transcriptional regulator AlpA
VTGLELHFICFHVSDKIDSYTLDRNLESSRVTTVNPFKPLTKDDIGGLLGVSARTIENWVNDRTLPAPTKLGNRVYWHPNIFYAWLEHRLTSQDACDGMDASTATQLSVRAGKPKRHAQSKSAKTEIETLRSRERAKLDAMLL